MFLRGPWIVTGNVLGKKTRRACLLEGEKMRYSDTLIERVREANRIEDVISGYVRLQRKGASFMGLCPFHNEKTPSFSVHPARQMYHCFGCGASGDVYAFLMEYDRMSFTEAVQSLANRAGISVPEEEFTEEQKKAASEKSQLLAIQKEAATYFYRRLHTPEGRVAMEYLTGRGLTQETIRSFGLGYADKAGSGLYAWLKKKNYSDALLKESGLFVWDEARSRMSEKFWNRVMFPIMDINRRVIGFGGRVFGDAKPKYLNSPETKLFDKSRNLYGLYAAKSSREEQLMLCEGYMDVISLHQAGFTNAVASLGTSLTSQQAALLHRYTKEVLLLYDSDEAGVKAALRAIPLLRSAGITAKVVNLAPYKDPDELLKSEGSEALRARLEAAENGFLFEVRKSYEQYDMSDPQDASDFTHDTARRLMTFSDEIERNSYLTSVARLYRIDPAVLKRQLGKLAMQGVPYAEETAVLERPNRKREKAAAGERAEKTLLSWMSQKPELIGPVSEQLTEEDFGLPMNRTIAGALFRMYREGEVRPVSVLNLFEDSEEKSNAAAILEGSPLPEGEDALRRAVGEVLAVILTGALERKAAQMSGSDMKTYQEVLEYQRRLEELKKKVR